MFCPQCKSLLRPDGEQLRCMRCGYVREQEEGKNKAPREKLEADLKEVPVFEDLDTMPIDDSVTCPDCGNTGAYWHLRQTRAADEATTRFYRCTECGKTWREYS